MPRISVLLLLLLAGGYAPAFAQHVGVEYGGTQAAYGEALQRPTGLSGYLDLPVGAHVAIRVMAAHHTENRAITRSPCTGLIPPGRDCTPERFDGTARLTTFGAGIAVQLAAPPAPVQPEFYVLGTGSSVDVTFAARNNDARLTPITPDGLSVGVAVGGGVHYWLTRRIALSGRLGLHAPRFGACGTDAWFPFCERRVLPQLALGVRIGRARPSE